MEAGEIAQLSSKLRDADDGISERAADSLALRIAQSDDDIVEAIRKWMESGQMPQDPVVLEHSPASLAQRYYPSQVFGILQGLRSDREQTLHALESMPGRSASTD